MDVGSLTICDLSVRYGPVRALDHVSLEVPAGTVGALLGGSGAGKSTLLGAISGTLEGVVLGGTITCGDRRLDGLTAAEAAAAGVAHARGGRRGPVPLPRFRPVPAALNRALRTGPRVLLLDDPELDASAPAADAVRELARRGTAVLLAGRSVDFALADVAYVLEAGRVVVYGDTAEPAAFGTPAGSV